MAGHLKVRPRVRVRLRLSQVLKGVRVMFSRIIPLDEEASRHALWVMAERFGATCTTHMGSDVTHLITNTQHTLKVC